MCPLALPAIPPNIGVSMQHLQSHLQSASTPRLDCHAFDLGQPFRAGPISNQRGWMCDAGQRHDGFRHSMTTQVKKSAIQRKGAIRAELQISRELT